MSSKSFYALIICLGMLLGYISAYASTYVIKVGSSSTTAIKTEYNYQNYVVYSSLGSSYAEYKVYSQTKINYFGFYFDSYEYNANNIPLDNFAQVLAQENWDDYNQQFIYQIRIDNESGGNYKFIYFYVYFPSSQGQIFTIEVSTGFSILMILLIIIGCIILIYVGSVAIAMCLGRSFTEGLCICLICFACLCAARH